MSIAALYSIKALSLDTTLPSFSHKENPPSPTQSAALIDYQTPKRGDIFDGGSTVVQRTINYNQYKHFKFIIDEDDN